MALLRDRRRGLELYENKPFFFFLFFPPLRLECDVPLEISLFFFFFFFFFFFPETMITMMIMMVVVSPFFFFLFCRYPVYKRYKPAFPAMPFRRSSAGPICMNPGPELGSSLVAFSGFSSLSIIFQAPIYIHSCAWHRPETLLESHCKMA